MSFPFFSLPMCYSLSVRFTFYQSFLYPEEERGFASLHSLYPLLIHPRRDVFISLLSFWRSREKERCDVTLSSEEFTESCLAFKVKFKPHYRIYRFHLLPFSTRHNYFFSIQLLINFFLLLIFLLRTSLLFRWVCRVHTIIILHSFSDSPLLDKYFVLFFIAHLALVIFFRIFIYKPVSFSLSRLAVASLY